MDREDLSYWKKVNNNSKKAYIRALRLLSKKSYSEKELKEKLSQFDKIAVDGIIQRLKEDGFVDDKKLAEKIVEKSLERKKGLYYIIRALIRKKIPEEIIKQIKENFDFEREYKIAEELAEKRKDKSVSSLFLFLKGKGFSPNTLNKIREKYGK